MIPKDLEAATLQTWICLWNTWQHILPSVAKKASTTSTAERWTAAAGKQTHQLSSDGLPKSSERSVFDLESCHRLIDLSTAPLSLQYTEIQKEIVRSHQIWSDFRVPLNQIQIGCQRIWQLWSPNCLHESAYSAIEQLASFYDTTWLAPAYPNHFGCNLQPKHLLPVICWFLLFSWLVVPLATSWYSLHCIFLLRNLRKHTNMSFDGPEN